MLSCFYNSGTVIQIILLILSQITIITLTASVVLLFHRRCKQYKQAILCVLFLINALSYTLMQIDSRITGGEEGLHIPIPYLVFLLVTVASLVLDILILFSETANRRTIGNSSIKESFDNLPTGVCFFNEAGLPVLCNSAMYRFSFDVRGRDVQVITDLDDCLDDSFIPIDSVKKEGRVFILPNGKARHLEKRIFVHDDGVRYTQYIAADVTDLHKKRIELIEENEELRKVQLDLKKLSANVVAVTREEEILNTKMRVHDEMGRYLIAARKSLREDTVESITDSMAESWQRAVSMLKYNNDTPDEDMLSQIIKTCEVVKLEFKQTGQLPEQEDVAYILTCAVRECVTNAVRYAGADKLYAEFIEGDGDATVVVTNSGIPPEREIIEGGGLSTLRNRVERAGGCMKVQSFPCFKLTVTIPKGKEVTL
ncbi:MAG: hypothetical protein E7591_01565 [Ruminococcaceae bacterium]|nr:hypothetical protein [Oscillospiraceae bacterium]